MMEDIKSGRINCIIVKDLSRLGRNYIEMGKYLEQIFPMMGIRFIAINDNYDNANTESSDSDSIVVPFKNLLNDSYCRDISIKVRSQLDMKRRKGEFIGGYAIYGYCKDERNKNRLVVDEYAADIVRSIYRRKLEGMSAQAIVRTIYMSFDKGMHPAEIAEKLNALEIRTIKNNPWTGESVKNILRNEKYCGDVLMQKTYTVDCLTHKTKKNEGEVEQYFIPDHHPAIVEREVWDKAQVRLEQIAGKRRRIRPKQQRLVPLRKGVLLGFVPIRPTWKAVSFKRLETATEKVMALVDAKPEQIHIEYESEECEMEILKGFEVINLKQPKGESVMTVTSNSLKFNKATAVELNYAPYIKVLLNAKTRQIAIQPCSEKDPNAIKFSNEESKQTYAISIKVPAIQVEFRRMLPFEDDNGGKLSYTLNGTLYPDEQVVIYEIGDVKPETEKKRRGRRKKSEIEAEQKEN